MNLCKGCQELRARVFSLEPLDEGKLVTIHTNFMELSECADTLCHLCKFIRREFYYCTQGNARRTFSDEELRNTDSAIAAKVIYPRKLWKLLLGLKDGPLIFPRAVEGTPMQNRQYQTCDPSLNSSLKLSRQWLKTCRTEHKKCGLQNGDDKSFLPTRLLDVGPPEQIYISLVVSGDLDETETRDGYVTLSYCWGQVEDGVCTTKENLEERLFAILTNTLPQTLQDAIYITRAFGVRYLWIDALCILQVKGGKNEDWERELSNMGKIYKHSLFTIAASSAGDSGDGCLQRREASLWPVQDYQLVDEENPQGHGDLILCPTLPSWETSVENSVLSSRGWVLQERYLASRTLFWTDDGLFWQCGQMRLSESENIGISGGRFCTLHEVAKNIGDHTAHESIRDAWIQIMQRFSRKKLTVDTDRLPAVEGLMRELSRLSGEHYEMGVWKQHFVFELAWMVNFPSCNRGVLPDSQVARLPEMPSWSWGSVNQELDFKLLRSAEYRELAIDASIQAQEVRIRVRMGDLHLQKMETEAGVYDFGFTTHYPHPCVFQPVCTKPVEELYLLKMEIAVFDTPTDALPAEGGTVKCIAWVKSSERVVTSKGECHDASAIGAMMIAPVNEEKKIYRRIGWAELLYNEFFEENYQDITIV